MTYAGVMISLDVPRGRRIKWLEADRWPFVICRPTECWPQVGKIGARGSAGFFFFFLAENLRAACGQSINVPPEEGLRSSRQMEKSMTTNEEARW